MDIIELIFKIIACVLCYKYIEKVYVVKVLEVHRNKANKDYTLKL